MNNFEEKIKEISKQEINIPDNFEKSVNEALEYIYSMKKTQKISNKKALKNKLVSIFQKVAILLLTGTLGLTAYAGLTGNLSLQKLGLNKLSQNFEESKVSVNQTIENEYISMNLENIARDSAYIILEYKIDLKEKAINEFGEITYTDEFGYGIGPACEIILEGEKSPFYIEYVDKESDTQYSYYQIIYTMNYDTEVLDLKIWFDYLWTESYSCETVPINETIEIKSKIDKIEDSFEKQEQKLDDGSTVILDKILNTNFQTFVRIKRVMENITLQEYEDSNSFQYKSFLITDAENNMIPYRTYMSDIIGRKYYNAETGEVITDENIYGMKENDKQKLNIKVEENYVILLDNVSNIRNIKVIPIKSRIYNDRTNEENEMYNKATWYPLTEGDKKYSASSDLGGILEINNIKIDEEHITFSYSKNGIVENGITYVLIRNKNKAMNYVCPSTQDESNSGEITFSRDLFGSSGLGIYEGMLDNIDDLEFTLLFGNVTEYDGVPFEAIIPELSTQKLDIENINRTKTNTIIIKFAFNSKDYTYIIDYDNDDNILKFNGGTEILNYIDNKKLESINVRNCKKAEELVKSIKKHLEFKNIEYTIEYK